MDRHKSESSSGCVVQILAPRVVTPQMNDNRDHWMTKMAFDKKNKSLPFFCWRFCQPHQHTWACTHIHTPVDSVQTWSPSILEKQPSRCFGRFSKRTNRRTSTCLTSCNQCKLLTIQNNTSTRHANQFTIKAQKNNKMRKLTDCVQIMGARTAANPFFYKSLIWTLWRRYKRNN